MPVALAAAGSERQDGEHLPHPRDEKDELGELDLSYYALKLPLIE
jgi:hypothetical protein